MNKIAGSSMRSIGASKASTGGGALNRIINSANSKKGNKSSEPMFIRSIKDKGVQKSNRDKFMRTGQIDGFLKSRELSEEPGNLPQNEKAGSTGSLMEQLKKMRRESICPGKIGFESGGGQSSSTGKSTSCLDGLKELRRNSICPGKIAFQ